MLYPVSACIKQSSLTLPGKVVGCWLGSDEYYPITNSQNNVVVFTDNFKIVRNVPPFI